MKGDETAILITHYAALRSSIKQEDVPLMIQMEENTDMEME